MGRAADAGGRRCLGAAERAARRLLVHRPALRLRRPAQAVRPLQLRLAERAGAPGSGDTHGGRPPVATYSSSRTASASMVIRTSSPTTTPPESRRLFQLTPKSCRLMAVSATNPA